MTATTPQLNWSTPEGFTFELPLADVARRGLALAIDLAVISAALQLLRVVLTVTAHVLPGLSNAVYIFAAFVLEIFYAALLEWRWQGQTIGKRALGLRVVDVHGLPLRGTQVLVRNLLRVIDLLPGLYLVGGIAALVTRSAQRLGDLVAGTAVALRADSPDLPTALPGPTPGRHNSLRQAPDLALRLRRQITPAESALIAAALQRRDQLDSTRRAEIYADLMNLFQSKVRFPPELTATLSPEQYLRDVAALLAPSILG